MAVACGAELYNYWHITACIIVNVIISYEIDHFELDRWLGNILWKITHWPIYTSLQ